MTGRHRKTEKKASSKNNLIVIAAISLFLIMVSGAAAVMNYEENSNDIPHETVDKYQGENTIPDINKDKQIKTEDNSNSTVNNDLSEKKDDIKEEPPKERVFNFPCNKEIICEYSGNTPVFSDILQDWRTHPAIDYADNEQFDIKAMSDGVIEDIYTDGLMGITILIDHGDGIKSVYQSLDENITVKQNDTVTAETVIGKSGKTAVTEKYEEKYLLHFAVLKDGEYKNPAEIINR